MNKYILLTLSVLFSLHITAQQRRHFFTSEELSSELITCISQDKTGLMWVGTEYGLNKYDGYRFTNYLHEEGNPGSLPSSNITSLFSDPQGQLWVGTSVGLTLYDEANDQFISIDLPSPRKPRINDIIQEDENHILLGTAGYGLFRLDTRSRKATPLHHYAKTDSNFFSHIFIDAQGNFWKAGSQSNYSCRRKSSSGKIEDFESPYGPITAFVGFDGGVLMICRRGMIYHKDGNVDANYIDMSLLQGKDILLRTAITDKKGNVYVGTMGNGLCWIPKGSRHLQRYEYEGGALHLASSNVWVIFDDRQDNLWVGCLRRGLLLLPQQKPLFNSWTFAIQNAQLGGAITSICRDDNGMTWCAVQNNGIYGFDSQGHLSQHPQSPPDTYSIFKDRSGNFWIGGSKGLYSYNPNTGNYTLRVPFESNYINAFADDGKGHYYFSVFSKGLCVWDSNTGQLKNYNMQMTDSKKGCLRNDWILSLLLEDDNILWIGTPFGLCRYNVAEESFLFTTKSGAQKDIVFEGRQVNSILKSRVTDNGLLVGTDAGLFIYDGGGETPATNDKTHLKNLAVNSLIYDNAGNLWCGTSMGIWQLSERQNNAISYINGNGLAGREYVLGAGFIDNGRIFFATNDGITSFIPENMHSSQKSLGTIHLTGLFIGGKAVNCSTLSNDRQVMSQKLSETKHFTLSYLDNTFTMEFSLLDFSNTDNIVLEYRINGSKEWSRTVAGQNVVAFHHLQPGTYNIEVRANNNGAYSEVGKWQVTVTPPWYRSVWGYSLYAILALSLAGLALWDYNRRKSRKMEDEKVKFLINATHDIRSPLTLIMAPLHKLMSRTWDDETSVDLKTIEHNANRIQDLVNHILDIRKYDKHRIHLQCQPTEMVEYMRQLLRPYEYSASTKGLRLHYKPNEENLMMWLDRKAFDKVIDNLLSNAMKFTCEGGDITVGLRQDEHNNAVITVADSGIGIKGNLNRIFDRFYQGASSSGKHFEGTGIGLNLCKTIVEMHHGTIEAANRTDRQGSIFTVKLPLGAQHLKKEEMMPDNEEEKTSRKTYTSYRVMVVDDDKEIGRFIERELGLYYHIRPVVSAREALSLLLEAQTSSDHAYDLVVCDVMMPDLDGFALLRLIKTNMNLSHIPVVMLTSKADVANRLQGLEKGADAYLSKPFDMDELHVVINNLIHKNLHLKGKFSGAQQQKDKVEEKVVKGNDDVLMERVMKAVNEHLSDSNYTVEALANDVGLSRAQLHRKMKSMTGISVGEFIRNLRLEQATKLLKEQKINVTQIAYTVGFSSVAHFSTVFRKQFGVSPSEYVKKGQGTR